MKLNPSSESPPRFKREDMRTYQVHATDWVKEKPACALFLDMGMGKTVAALSAIVDLKWEYEVGNVLVCAPLRVARKTWTDEIETWAHTRGLTVAKILGNANERRAGIEAKADIHLINHDNVKWLVDQFVHERRVVRPWPWDMIVLDESSAYRTSSAKRFKALKKIRRYVTRIVELTGTPAPKGLINLWAQIYLLDRGERLGLTITAYRQRWFDWNPYSHTFVPKGHAEAEILERIEDLCLTLREDDYLDLPPIIYNPVKTYLSPGELREYQAFEKSYVMELKGQRITAVNAGVLAGKLLQLANGHVYVRHPQWEVFHHRKLETLMELLEAAQGKPVMVCYNYRPDLFRLRETLTKAKVNFDVLTDTASEDRWNEGRTDVLLLHPASAGHGLNLHHSGSELIIWFGLTWDLELWQQAIARLGGGHRRVGKNLVVNAIVTDQTQDERVLGILGGRKSGQDRMLNHMRQLVRST